jgi:hypothetical protein
MAVENRSVPPLRLVASILAVGLIGFGAGAVGGYLAYSYPLIFASPLINPKGSANDSAFDQTYRGMARLGGLEAAAGRCDGKPVPREVVERERQIIDQVEATSKGANLDPPVSLARAIVAYRSAKIAEAHSDKEASDYSIQQGVTFLRAAGWNDASQDRLAAIVRESDNCQPQGVLPGEKK